MHKAKLIMGRVRTMKDERSLETIQHKLAGVIYRSSMTSRYGSIVATIEMVEADNIAGVVMREFIVLPKEEK